MNCEANLVNKGIFLDRDGVINEVIFRGGKKPIAPWNMKEFKLRPGLKEPLAELSKMGYLLFVVSNQPDISKGHVEASVVERMNKIIKESFPIEEVVICPHVDNDACNCRKPKPGMLMELSKRWKINLSESFMVGDSWKDVEAGKSSGCKTILLDKKYNKGVDADYRVKDLISAVKMIKSIEGNIEKRD